MRTPENADQWFDWQTDWHDELALLRAIVLEAGLVETVKWKHPCYMDGAHNVVILGVRKQGVVCSVLRGALVDDPQGRLVQPGQDRSSRYMPFASVDEIVADRAYLTGLITQAIELTRAGVRVERLPDEIDYVAELQDRMNADPVFRAAFEALTPGRRRGYNLFFGKAKRAATREARITQYTERILAGKGHMDCVCGRSKRPPRCDGTHRHPA